jgi:hypothetical protein
MSLDSLAYLGFWKCLLSGVVAETRAYCNVSTLVILVAVPAQRRGS